MVPKMKMVYDKLCTIEQRQLEQARRQLKLEEVDCLLDADEARQLLNLTRRVFDELVKSGDIPCVKLSQKTKRFRKKALLEWMANRETGGLAR
jgi:excisionase family DNA binding protein